MNIAIFGWYHHQNAGDDRMQYCLTRRLDGHTLAFLPAGRPPSIDLLRTYDAALIGGGGLLMRRGGLFRNMTRWIRQAGIPVALAGVSVERPDPELLSELRAFLDVCSFAWFRDRGSLEAIGAHPRAFVAPDITWLYPFEKSTVEGRGMAVNLRPPRDRNLELWRDHLEGLNVEVRPWPLYFERGGDRSVLAELFTALDIPTAFDPDVAATSAAVVTARYHGVQFALQMGRPFIALSHQPKTRRFLEEHGLEDLCLADDQLESGIAALEQAIANPDSSSQRLSPIRERLLEEVWTLTDEAFSRWIDEAASLPRPSRRLGSRIRKALNFGDLF